MAKIEMCEKMTGKMEGMISVSTSVLTNPNCNKNSKIEGAICSHCYSRNMASMYKALDAKNQRNTDILTTEIIPIEELPSVDSKEFPWARLEAFGDLHNEIQLENYMNLVRKNHGSKWALYTKMYDLAWKYFSTHDVPENFTLVISSLMVNKPIDISRFKTLGKFKEGQLKVFTVYDKDYISKHPELKINCGAKSCFSCHRCYDQRPETEVNEILKSDSTSASFLIGLRDETRIKNILNRFHS